MVERRHLGCQARKLYPPFNSPYLVVWVQSQNAHCLPLNGNPEEAVHVLKLKPLKREAGKKETIDPTLLDKDGFSESNTEIPCASLSE